MIGTSNLVVMSTVSNLIKKGRIDYNLHRNNYDLDITGTNGDRLKYQEQGRKAGKIITSFS